MTNGIKVLAPYNKTIEDARPGETLLELLRRHGVLLNARCGGKGTCGRCAVILDGKRVLACRQTVSPDMARRSSSFEIYVPELSRLEEIYFQKDTIEDRLKIPRASYPFLPLVEKIFISGDEVRTDFSGEWERIASAISLKTGIPDLTVSLDILRDEIASADSSPTDTATAAAGDGGWTAAVFRDNPEDRNSARVLSLVVARRGDETLSSPSSSSCYGIAVDLGTTTVAVALVDMKRASVIDAAVGYNRQITHGEDVITRILFAESSEGLDILSHLASETINDLTSELLYRNKVDSGDVWAVAIAGNTAMSHILYKINPSQIRRAPFAPVAQFLPTVSPERIGLRINPDAGVIASPSVSAYVGGDITAGMLATDMFFLKGKKSMLVDAGTNGEIVFTDGDFIVCASCSAGPAFEGVGIKSGMHAVSGAIDDVKFEDGRFTYTVIGGNGAAPKGICGSGLISLLCALLDSGVMDASGKLDASHPRVRKYDDHSGQGLEFVLVARKDVKEPSAVNYDGEDITISESDIENLMRSKGAVYMGIDTLLKEMGFTTEEVEKIYLAGGFGNSLDIKKAIRIGMLPDLPENVYEFVGNSSLEGAVRMLLSYEARRLVHEAARRMTYIDLGSNPYFMNEYTATLFFPHTDIKRFPSVKKNSAR